MKIKVTDKQIKCGRRDMPTLCPVAKAIRASIHKKGIAVWSQVLWVKDKKYQLPKKVQRFIERFDKGKLVRPFTFNLEIPTTRKPQ